jgi:hypothetical protein
MVVGDRLEIELGEALLGEVDLVRDGIPHLTSWLWDAIVGPSPTAPL